jgi:hypothetical protein
MLCWTRLVRPLVMRFMASPGFGQAAICGNCYNAVVPDGAYSATCQPPALPTMQFQRDFRMGATVAHSWAAESWLL